MVANGKSDVKLLNSYLKDYYNLIFGKNMSTTESKKNTDLNDQLKGFRKMFNKVTLKPKFGKKLDSEFSNVSLKDLMKMENK